MDLLCSVEVAAVRAEPRADAERVTELLRGEPVSIEERRNGWARILTAYDYPGWVREEERGIDCSGLVHMSYRWLGRLVPRDADQQEEAGAPVTEDDLDRGDLITYGDESAATHIAFWLGDGRILHSTEREGVDGVVEEVEPTDLHAQRRRLIRL
jgi:cell wall-associated NlpC family hydrolase